MLLERMVEVIGLGTGGLNDLDQSLYGKLKEAGTIYMRTKDFPLAKFLEEQGIKIISFDSVYEKEGDFESVYRSICKQLIDRLEQERRIIYCVPGHPRVAERTVRILMEEGETKGFQVKILGGHSFLDQAFISFGFDPIDGFLLLDGTSLRDSDLNPSQHTLIAQIYDRMVASDVKLTLMSFYPDEYPVWIGSYLGTDREELTKMPLFQIDQEGNWNNFSLLYVPPVEDEQVLYRRFSYVKDIVATLRSPEGCPWDREQTHQSLRKYLIEETYEVLEAIDVADPDALQEELGDLLLQILLHSQIAEEDGYFNIFDVINTLSEKLIRRHPHVFAENKINNTNEALTNWQNMKNKEKRLKGINPEYVSILDDLPKGLPSLVMAYQLQKKAAEVGFDWDTQQEVLKKVEEEWQEFQQASGTDEKTKEFGDLLFALVNLARFMKIDPEESLAKTNLKFKQRFRYIEQKFHFNKEKLTEASLEEMEQLWQEAKKVERSRKK